MLERPENFVRTLDPSECGIHLTQFLQVLAIHELRQGWKSWGKKKVPNILIRRTISRDPRMTLFEQGRFTGSSYFFPTVLDKHSLRSVHLLLHPLEAALHKLCGVREQGLRQPRTLVRVIRCRHLKERALERREIHGMSSEVSDE